MKNRKGIILAGGSATRLYPLTLAISKQIMPVYDKPMIYYPLSVLMEADIKEILIISTPRDIVVFKELLGDGSKWGMHFEYKVQEKPAGLAEAFILGADFIGEDNVAMILGDNMFYGNNLCKILKHANEREDEATVFGYYVKDPKAYGVVEIDKEGNAVSIEEKPEKPKSHYTVTHDSLLETASFVQTIEKRQGMQICSPDAIAYEKGWITSEELSKIADKYMKTDYGRCLKDLAENMIGEE